MSYIFGPEAIDDLKPETIARMRQQAKDRAIAAFLMNKLKGYFLPTRVRLAIERAYYMKVVDKPVEQLTDREILNIRNIGPKALAEIRKLLPSPQAQDNSDYIGGN
jgi:hypothetical protein